MVTLAAQSPKSQWSGVYTEEQADRGNKIYTVQCLACHGANLQGYEQEDIPAPELTGDDFVEFWSEYTLAEIFEKMQASEPQDDPGSLEPQAYADLLAFILQVGKYPAGTTELPADAAALREYKFLSKNPGAQAGR
jgi:mono/diheme cytochrome c family protein